MRDKQITKLYRY